MGGGGSFYDRDVTSNRYRSSTGVSTVAERELGRTSVDAALLPKGRRLTCTALNPLVYDFDVTGSMDILPKIIWDKWPGIVGQVVARKYLPDPEMSITATGDIRSDSAPLQMCDFSPLRNLDRWLKRIYFEKCGGGQGSESYAETAYFYLKCFDMPKAVNPIYLITGDEACEQTIYGKDLREHFGGEHGDTTAAEVFSGLLKKFKGNVYRIHRRYGGMGSDGWTNSKIEAQWKFLIGRERVIDLPEDLAIGDITLGVYAIISGSRTLAQYLEDMRTRPLDLGEGVTYEPQSPERIREVEEALQPLKDFKPVKAARSTSVGSEAKTSSKKKKSTDKRKSKTEDSWKV